MPRPRLDHVRKAQIIAAAATVLSERGYANTRVVDIATEAGTSPAAVLYWFEGKDALLAEALRLQEQEFHDRYTLHAEAAETAAERLRLLVQAMVRHYDWPLWMELCVLAIRDPAAAAAIDDLRVTGGGSDVQAALDLVATLGVSRAVVISDRAEQFAIAGAEALDALRRELAARRRAFRTFFPWRQGHAPENAGSRSTGKAKPGASRSPRRMA